MNEMHFTPEDRFEIGGEELLASVHAESLSAGPETRQDAAGRRQREALEDILVRVGTLLKTETVSFLLGAGASIDCGGQQVNTVPLLVERNLNNEGITGAQKPRIRRWLRVFYLAARCAGGDDSIARDSSGDSRSSGGAQRRGKV